MKRPKQQHIALTGGSAPACASGLRVAIISHMKSCLLLAAVALSIPATALADRPAGVAPGALAPTAEQCADCDQQKAAPPADDSERRGGGITLTVFGSLGIAGGIAQIIAGEVMTNSSCGPDEDCLITDARMLDITGGVTLGLGAVMLPFGIILLATDVWKDDSAKAAASGQPFAIDQRPRTIAPRYWLGEF